MIKRNDPTFTKLKIESNGEYHHLPGDDWEALGVAIGGNTNLKEVYIQFSMRAIPFFDFEGFLRGLALNRSIKKLSIAGWDHSDAAVPWNLLTQFLIRNQAFECLEMDLRWHVENN